MTSLLFIWLTTSAFCLLFALIIDLRPHWLNPQHIVDWPFKGMTATNGIIFVGTFFTVLISLIMLFGTKGLG